MKNIAIVIIVLSAAFNAVAADPQAKKKKTAAPVAAPSRPMVTIPKDAVQNPDGSFSYTDKDGKKWVYLKTPFGITKAEAPQNPVDRPADLSSVKAFDKGETVRFERPSPFGTTTWEKKKTELTDDERKILDGQSAKPEAATQNEKTQ